MMRYMSKAVWVGFISTAVMVLSMSVAQAQMSLVNYQSGIRIEHPVESLADRKFSGVVKQHFDFSCGSAAVATMLTHHYERNTSEQEALEAMYAVGNQEKIEKEGFSMLDMKKFLEKIGYTADGYRQPLDRLKQVGVPAIALINYNGYLHFVVIKGISDDQVLVGDPALGLRSVDRKTFEAMWNGIMFVVKDDIELARMNFNRLSDWASIGHAPLSAWLGNGGNLADFTLQLKTTGNYFGSLF